MGYEINSTWTRLCENDIKRLNEVIDNKYCIELEIGRKLNMMKKFEEKLDEEINNLNWDNILKFMHDNDWKWYVGGGLNNCEIPTKEYMIKSLRSVDYFGHGLYEIIELGKNKFSISCGGFNFEMGYNGGNNYWVNICFDIAHFSKD